MHSSSDERWRTWKDDTLYGETLNRRARGELPEMESAKSTARRLAAILREGDSLADLGCGCGHYLPTFRRLIPVSFAYTGVDATPQYLEHARQTFAGQPGVDFALADVTRLPFADAQFDVATSANMLLHLPGVTRALPELVRIARRHVLVRTLVGDRSFVVKEVKPGPPEAPGDEFLADGEPRKYSYFNIHSREHVEFLLSRLPRVRRVEISADTDFDPASLEADTSMEPLSSLRTRTLSSMQVLGYLLLPWAFISIELDG